MKENVIKDKSFEFAVKIVNLSRALIKEEKEFVISKQILKSGTSIGANVEEADGGISKADFSSKISIAYKEAKETLYWLRLLHETNLIRDELFHTLKSDCDEICKILFSIIKTTRINNN